MKNVATFFFCVALVFLAFGVWWGGVSFVIEQPAFDERPLSEVRADAQRDGKWLLVVATDSADERAPLLTRGAWTSAAVRLWVDEHALLWKLDLAVGHADLAHQLRIDAPHVVVAFRDGAEEEFDRLRDAWRAEPVLAWLRHITEGKTADDVLRETGRQIVARHREQALDNDIDARVKLAESAQRYAYWDDALEQLLWLWDHAAEHDESWIHKRRGKLASDLQKLGERHPPTRATFAARADALAPRVDEDTPDLGLWLDWSTLCLASGRSDELLAWYERHRDSQGRLLTEQRPVLDELFDVLLDHDRGVEAGRLYPDPRYRTKQHVALFQTAIDAYTSGNEEQRARHRDVLQRLLRRNAARLSAALVEAGREYDALDVAELLLVELDDADSRVALASRVVESGAPALPQHLTWLDEAAERGADVTDLRPRVSALLDG